MVWSKKNSYKYCIVPICRSTTVKTPDKKFFRVPSEMNQRKKWCKVMRRDLIAPKSTKYVCEDHFDIENDTENLVKYRLVGGLLKLKPNVYPHKFECQKGAKTEREMEENEKQIEFYKNILLKQEEPSTSSESIEMVDCVKIESNETEDPLPEDITYTESVPDDHVKDNKNELVEEKDRLYKEQRSIADKLATEVKNLRCKNANLEARCASQEETIATLKQQVETAKQSEKEFRDATRNLSASHQKSICQLEAKVKCLTTRIDKQNALIDNLKKQNALLRTNGALKALEQDYNEFLNSE